MEKEECKELQNELTSLRSRIAELGQENVRLRGLVNSWAGKCCCEHEQVPEEIRKAEKEEEEEEFGPIDLTHIEPNQLPEWINEINELRKENARLEKTEKLYKRFLKDVSEGMECPDSCDSYAHDDLCPFANPPVAFRKLQEDNAHLREAVEWALATGGPADVGNLADWKDELRRKAGEAAYPRVKFQRLRGGMKDTFLPGCCCGGPNICLGHEVKVGGINVSPCSSCASLLTEVEELKRKFESHSHHENGIGAVSQPIYPKGKEE